MVGRKNEWATLLRAWQSAGPGVPTAVLVTGEAGVGKTRLVEELRDHCERAPAAIGVARSYESGRTLAHSVVVSWLRSQGIAQGADRLGDDQRRTLARLLPELGPVDVLTGASAALEQRLLYDATAAALTATGRPVLLIADDAHWSDPASLAQIQHLARQRFDVPVMIVLTMRLEDVDTSACPAAVLRADLTVSDQLVELSVQRLALAATTELGGELLDVTLAPEVGAALFAESEGNPLVIVEMVRAGWTGSGQVAISPRLRAVIDARFRQLSTAARQVLDAAAVVGRPCSATMLHDVSGIGVQALVEGLDELWKRRILVESGTEDYEFSHGKLREVAYESIGPARRRHLHDKAALASIGAAEAAGARHASAVIAEHFVSARRIDEAVTWLHRAALEAFEMFAYAEATQLLERALELVPQLAADVRHLRELELLSAMPSALAGVDGYGTARMSATHERALAVSSTVGRELEPSFVRSMVMSALCRDQFADAAAMAEQLRLAAAENGDADLDVESHYLLGISAFWAARLDEASRCFTRAVNEFATETRRHHQFVYGHDPYVVCQSRHANTLWFLGRADEAVVACDTALDVAIEVAHPLSHDTAVIFACVLAIDLGDPDRLQSAAALLGSLGMDSLPHATKRRALRGLLDVLDGHRQGLGEIEAALDACAGRNFYPGFRHTILRVLLAAHEAIGEPSAGLHAVDRALTAGGTPLWKAEAHRLQAVFLHAQHAPPSEVAHALALGLDTASRQGALGHLRRIDTTRGLLAAG